MHDEDLAGALEISFKRYLRVCDDVGRRESLFVASPKGNERRVFRCLFYRYAYVETKCRGSESDLASASKFCFFLLLFDLGFIKLEILL